MSLLMSTAASQSAWHQHKPVCVLMAICIHTCVCGLGSRAVRSAFSSRQHKVIRRWLSAGGAPSASTVQFHFHSTVILCSPSAIAAILCSQDKLLFGHTIVGRFLKFILLFVLCSLSIFTSTVTQWLVATWAASNSLINICLIFFFSPPPNVK